MNSRYASGKYSFEIRLSEEVPEGRKEVAQRFIAGLLPFVPPGLYYRKIENMSNTQESLSPISIQENFQGRLSEDVLQRNDARFRQLMNYDDALGWRNQHGPVP